MNEPPRAPALPSMPSVSFDSADLLNGGIAIGIGVYLAAVLIQGNLSDLWTDLSGELGYVEFLVALFIISLLASFGPTSQITDMLIVLALIGFAFRIATNSPKVISALQNFGNGQTDLFGTFKAIFA